MGERKVILIADEDGLDRELLNQILAGTYEVVLADDGKQALADVQKWKQELAAVLVDWNTPLVGGYQILQVLYSQRMMEKIPVIVTTGDADIEIDQKAYGMDAIAVIRKPYAATVVRKQMMSYINAANEREHLRELVEQKDKLLAESQKKLDGFYDNLLDAISTVVEYRTQESDRHIKRISGFTRLMAVAYRNHYPACGLDESAINRIVRGSAIHDIGKLAVPDSILAKPAKLTEDERQVMMSHTTKGEEIMQMLREVQDEEQFRVSCEICRWHHERYDGSGYPDGLEGEEIPLSAQIVSIVDVYDALVSERIYKKPYDKETAFQMIMKGECGAFAPELLRCFEASKKLLELYSDSN